MILGVKVLVMAVVEKNARGHFCLVLSNGVSEHETGRGFRKFRGKI